jgi:CHAT domain-containing protein/tetratricopeptide (TPR) repeat protein
MSGGIYQQLAELDQQFNDYYQAAHYLQAIVVAKQMRALAERHLDEQDKYYAGCLNQLAVAYEANRDYEAAKQLYQKLLSLDPPDSIEHAQTLHNWANLCESMGEYSTAEIAYQQALDLKLELLDEYYAEVARTQNDLGYLYYQQGEYGAAESFYKRALEIWEQDPNKYGEKIATVYNNLAMLYEDMDRFAQAEEFYKEAANIDKVVLGDFHPSYAVDLNNQAYFHARLGEYTIAEGLFNQVLEIMQYHQDYLGVALCFNNLGWLYQLQGDFTTARIYFKDALQLRGELLGRSHPDYADCVNNLAALDEFDGRFDQAEAGYRETYEIYRQSLGESHPRSATVLNNLAILYAVQGQRAEALSVSLQVAAAHDQLIDQVFALGSESQRMAYLQNIRWGSAVFISLAALPAASSQENINACFELVLRRKGLMAEVLVAQREALLAGRYPQLAEKIQSLSTLRAQIGQKHLAGPGAEGLSAYQQQVADWTAQREQLEVQLASSIPEISLQLRLQNVHREAVAQALPAGTALVEFICTEVYDFLQRTGSAEMRWKAPIYLALILHAGQPDQVQIVNLGQAEAIDGLIADFRKTITGGGRDVVPEEREADQVELSAQLTILAAALFEPLLPALGGCRRLLVAPDGELTQLPFEILTLDGEHYLIEDYEISYLSTGRDVLRFDGQPVGPPAEAVVIADPNYDLAASPSAEEQAESHIARELVHELERAGFPLKRLPGTREEGEQIGRLLGIQPLSGDQALEGRLKSLPAPQILHIATHGFFMPNRARNNTRDPGAQRIMSEAAEKLYRLSKLVDPLLRSGVALTGANTWFRNGDLPTQAEDGLLTAEDVSGLELSGTELVVLSACETGLGDVRVGEGVFGLRRAFTLAGANTLVMSLWRVPDQETQQLMVDFYRRLLAGQSRSGALRQAQLALKEGYPDPRCWAAFICQGDPRAL